MAPPRKMIHMGGGWDPFFVDNTHRAAFEAELEAIVGFQGTSQWAVHKGWAVDSYDYLNTFSDTNVSYAVNQLDSDGAVLWLPFGPPSEGAGTFARRSMDLRSETYRAGFAAMCRTALNDGAEGMFFDDVNLEWDRMLRRAGDLDPLTDFDSGAYYTSPTGEVGWKALLGDFLHDVIARVRSTHPAARFMFNAVWTDLTPRHPDGAPDWDSVRRWHDPNFERVIEAADWMVLEHGHTDSGLTDDPTTDGGPGFALRSQFSYVDHVHSLGTGVIVYANDDPATPAAEREYEVAAWLSHRTDADMIGLWGEHVRWPSPDPVFDTYLGERVELLDSNAKGSEIVVGFEAGRALFTPDIKTSAELSDAPLPPPVPGAVRFDSAGDQVILTRGDFHGWDGPFTLAALVRKTAPPGVRAVALSMSSTGVHSAAGGKGSLAVIDDGGDTPELGGAGGTWATELVMPTDEWCIIAASKRDAAHAGRFHLHVLSTGAWSHGDGWASRPMPEEWDRLVIGGWHAISDWWQGDVALVGAWNYVLSDREVEALEGGTARWWATGWAEEPPLLVEGRTRAEDLPVRPFEVLSGGQGQVSLAGTVGAPDDPPWEWGFDREADLPMPADLQAAHARRVGRYEAGGSVRVYWAVTRRVDGSTSAVPGLDLGEELEAGGGAIVTGDARVQRWLDESGAFAA